MLYPKQKSNHCRHGVGIPQQLVSMTRPCLDTSSELCQGLSDRLIARCARPIDHDARHQAARLVLDWCGISAAATQEQGARAIRSAMSASAGTGTCSAFGCHDLPPEAAAFVNGSLGTLLEMDDLHRASIMHTGDVVIPAALAAAQFAGCSGDRLLDAIVVGYEVALVLGCAAASGGYTAWYNSSTCGVFGAALAAAHAVGASKEAERDALGQAGMQASGLWQCRLEPTDSKAVATAHAARAAVTSALLGCQRVRGAKHILDGPLGFFASYYPEVDVSGVNDGLQGDWLLHDVSFKPWPACRHVHPAVGLALRLRDRVPVADIQRVRVATYAAALQFCDTPNPKSPHAARFSLQHCVATALLTGALRLEDTMGAGLDNPAVAQLRFKIDVSEDPACTAAFPNKMGARVEVQDKTGVTHGLSCDHAPGDPEDPLNDRALAEKFLANMAYAGVPKASAATLAGVIRALPDSPTLAPLTGALQTVSAHASDAIGKE